VPSNPDRPGECNTTKASLRARSGDLTVGLVTEQLLAAESEMLEQNRSLNVQNNAYEWSYQARNWSGGGRPYELESDIKLYICQ